MNLEIRATDKNDCLKNTLTEKVNGFFKKKSILIKPL